MISPWLAPWPRKHLGKSVLPETLQGSCQRQEGSPEALHPNLNSKGLLNPVWLSRLLGPLLKCWLFILFGTKRLLDLEITI